MCIRDRPVCKVRVGVTDVCSVGSVNFIIIVHITISEQSRLSTCLRGGFCHLIISLEKAKNFISKECTKRLAFFKTLKPVISYYSSVKIRKPGYIDNLVIVSSNNTGNVQFEIPGNRCMVSSIKIYPGILNIADINFWKSGVTGKNYVNRNS